MYILSMFISIYSSYHLKNESLNNSLTGYEQLHTGYTVRIYTQLCNMALVPELQKLKYFAGSISGTGLWKSASHSVVLQVTVGHFLLESNTMEGDGSDGMHATKCILYRLKEALR